MSELKPCPFCGGEAETWDGAGPWHAICTKCGTIGSPCLTEAEAIAAWNTRAVETCSVVASYSPSDMNEDAEWYFAFSCGHELYWDEQEPPKHCPECGKKVKVSE